MTSPWLWQSTSQKDRDTVFWFPTRNWGSLLLGEVLRQHRELLFYHRLDRQQKPRLQSRCLEQKHLMFLMVSPLAFLNYFCLDRNPCPQQGLSCHQQEEAQWHPCCEEQILYKHHCGDTVTPQTRERLLAKWGSEIHVKEISAKIFMLPRTRDKKIPILSLGTFLLMSPLAIFL